jgi:hypothetical protein
METVGLNGALDPLPQGLGVGGFNGVELSKKTVLDQ